MPDDPRVEQLLEELLDSGGTPEEACRTWPELLPEVRKRWQQLRALQAEVGALFPQSPAGNADTPPPLPRVELPRIRGYELLKVLGSGGMGVVYKAWHARLNRTVALKMLLAGPYAAPGELERFLREAETVAGLRHPNIVQVHEADDVDGRPYFTMEFVEGGSLAEKMAGTPQPARQAAALVATVAEAVHAAHQRGVVHRDLKPANILLTEDGTPKLTDFGLARRLEGAAGLTQSGAPLGTPSYMAPEQAEGKSDLGPAADTYALGAILYELLTGRPPFRAETATETVRQVISQDPVPPSRLNAAVPRDAETICLKCLEKDPQRRYASAAALAEDLHRFLRHEPIAARPVGRVERMLRWARRDPTAAALVVTGLAFIALALGGAGWLIKQRADRRAEQGSEVGTDLAEAASLRKRLDFDGARGRVDQAEHLVEASGLDRLRAQVGRARADLELVEKLDRARLCATSLVNGRFEPLQAEPLYEEAFAKAGLGRPGDDSTAVTARVRDSALRDELVAALDDWAGVTGDPARRAWLLAVARGADPDPSRDRLRQPELWKKGPALTRLAQEVPVDKLSPQLATAIGRVLRKTKPRGDSVPLLRAAQERFPQDFWLNFDLGYALLLAQRWDDALSYNRAALALRPQASMVHNNIAMSLFSKGQADEAIRHFQEALRLDPKSPEATNNLGMTLKSKGRLDEAILFFRQALRLSPSFVQARRNLASTLSEKGEVEEAIREVQQALQFEPDHADARRDLFMYRWAAACAALRQGPQKTPLGEQERAGRRRQALQWLRADLELFASVLQDGKLGGSSLSDWQRDSDLAGVRDQAALAKLPDTERQQWQRFWADVAARVAADPLEQGRTHAARREWDKAAGCYARALKRGDTDDSHFWFEYAAVLLLSGDRPGYAKACTQMVERYGKTHKLRAYHVARACTLAPDAVADASLPGRLAEAELLDAGEQFWSLTEQGALHYRAGRFAQAVALFEQSLRVDAMPGRAVVNWLRLALAKQRLGKAEEARRWLDKAAAWLDQYRDGMPDRAEEDLGLHLHNWLEAQVLRREAEALIRPARLR